MAHHIRAAILRRKAQREAVFFMALYVVIFFIAIIPGIVTAG